MQNKALLKLMGGQSLTGKDGVFAPLLKQFLDMALETENAKEDFCGIESCVLYRLCT
jgi:hypothetical protein